MLVNAIRHQELRVFRPSVGALGEPDLFVAERLAMSFRSVLFVGRAVPDVAIENDQGGTACVVAEYLFSECSIRSISFASPTRRTCQP